MRISVIKPFTFNAAGVLTRYEIGQHTVSDEVGNHPFTLAHCGEPSNDLSASNEELMEGMREASRMLQSLGDDLAAERAAANELREKLVTASETIDGQRDQLALAESRATEMQGKLDAATTEAAQAAEAMTTLATANADLQAKLEAAAKKK